MLGYIYDFLSIVFEKTPKKKIRSIVLFGSQARGNARPDSDIDLFIDVAKEDVGEVSSLVKEALNEFELKARKSWNLRGIQNPIVPLVDDLNSDQWSELRSEIESYGHTLYNPSLSNGKSTHVLISYDISTISQKKKMRIVRGLYGYSLKKGRKTYEQTGLVQTTGSKKITQAIIAPREQLKKFKTFFKERE